ncbi:hypothetical protein I4U23_003789 [Adineta vaga]|nr:hypothetical protein I4U23_003789 [Adineta vaga]
MFKLVLIIIVLSTIPIAYCQAYDFPFAAGCNPIDSGCSSSTQCCSGYCYNQKCTEKCRSIFASCNSTKSFCCPGTQCRLSDHKCCRPGGQRALSPSECCGQKWISNTNGNAGQCCRLSGESTNSSTECCNQQSKPNTSGRGEKCCGLHGQSCQTLSDCCGDTMSCKYYPQFGNICI